MFSHPVSVAGYFAVGVGFLLVLLATGMRDGSLPYLLGMGLAGIGPFLMLLGVIAQGFLRLERHLAGVPQMKAAFAASERPTDLTFDRPAQGSAPIDPKVLQEKLAQLRAKHT